MTADSRANTDAPSLEVIVDSCGLPVSSVSTLLRVVQAALREIARSLDGVGEMMAQRPQPVLRLGTRCDGSELVMLLSFADPLDSRPLASLSSPTFEAFIEQLGQLVKELPQLSLWGESASPAGRRTFDSDVEKRLEQVRVELRRFPRVRLGFNRRVIAFEGDRAEIR